MKINKIIACIIILTQISFSKDIIKLEGRCEGKSDFSNFVDRIIFKMKEGYTLSSNVILRFGFQIDGYCFVIMEKDK